MILNLMARAQCKDLIQIEGTCVQMEGQNNYNVGMKSLKHVDPPGCDL